MSTAAPTWEAGNLTRHHQTRLREDPGCFEELLGITGRTMTEGEYEVRSLDAVANAWAEYEGQPWDEHRQDYLDARAYYIDNELVIAITDAFRRRFITCYHEHPRRRHTAPSAMPSVGQRRLEYRRRLQAEERGELILGVVRVNGF